MFEKSLQDLIKGIRNAGDEATAYIAKGLSEIKEELRSRDITIKTQALQKLVYLKMSGYDMSWAAFHVIEVMSQERFALKRAGFLAAAQSFTSTTDVLVLCTQLLKKEFMAKSPYEIGTAINTLANLATEDLARDLIGDVVTMLTSSRTYIRKKATLVLYNLYLVYPQGLRLTFDHLKRRLSDDEPSVVSCAVNVICELARKKPSNYLSLAPELFQLLTTTSNNWMLIKITKLMGSLVMEEPRLARKLLEPMANIVQTSSAKSLMYEAIATLTIALQHTKKADGTDAKNVPAVVRLCTDRLREFVRDPDQNLKYLGLVGLVGLMKSHPRVVAEHRELVLQCLLDEDVTIRLRALELVSGMITRRNLPDIITSLMGHLEAAEGHYRDALIEKIIFMCSRDKYAYLPDFAWYIDVLSKLAYISGTRHAATVASQLLDVAVRVEEVRPATLSKLLPMLADAVLFQHARTAAVIAAGGDASAVAAPGEDGTSASGGAAEGGAASALSGGGAVLYAAAWIVGEFCSIIPTQMHGAVLDALLAPSVASLPVSVQAAYVQCALKIVAAAASHGARGGEAGGAAFLKLASSVLDRLHAFAQSQHVEVQERACLTQQLLATLGVSFTPLSTPVSEAAAKAKEEEDLLALASGGTGGAASLPTTATSGGSSPSKAAAALGLPPLEADVKLIANVLNSLFAEQLKPVNSKAQKRVTLPDGLDLDKVINASASAAGDDEESGSFSYANISFEDSYGVEDNDYAAGAGGGGGGGRRKDYNIGTGADEDDEEWFSDMAKKSKKRDVELWGGDEAPKGKGKKGKKGHDEEEDAPRSSKGRAGDPFLLKSAKGASSRDRHGTEDDISDIPIRTLGSGDLTGGLKAGSLDVSIFGDFGKKAKGIAEEGGKKKKSKKKGGEDDALGEVPPGRQFRVISDEDMPPSTKGGSKGGKGGKGARGGDDDDDDDDAGVVDALANIDLSTPLGDDEVLPTQRHRSVQDPAALRAAGARKGGGRARVLAVPDEASAAAAGKKVSKKGKEEEEKPKKSKKGDAAAEAGDKKASKKGKGEEAAAAAAPAKEKKAKKGADAAPPATSGEDVACEAPFPFALVGDKVVRLTYAVAPAGTVGDASASCVATLIVRVEMRSTKKTLEWVDVALVPGEGAPSFYSPGCAALSAGAAPGSLRVASGLKPREKGAEKAAKPKKASLAISVADALVGIPSLSVRVSYKASESDKVVTLEGVVVLRAASLLFAASIEQDAFRALMGSELAGVASSVGVVPLICGNDAEATIKAVLGVLRAFAVARTPKHAILYARTSTGAHVTGLIKLDEAAKVLGLQVRSSAGVDHSALLLKECTEGTAAAGVAIAAAASDKD